MSLMKHFHTTPYEPRPSLSCFSITTSLQAKRNAPPPGMTCRSTRFKFLTCVFQRLESCGISTRHRSELNFCVSNFFNVQPCVTFRCTLETTSGICPTKLEETLSFQIL